MYLYLSVGGNLQFCQVLVQLRGKSGSDPYEVHSLIKEIGCHGDHAGVLIGPAHTPVARLRLLILPSSHSTILLWSDLHDHRICVGAFRTPPIRSRPRGFHCRSGPSSTSPAPPLVRNTSRTPFYPSIRSLITCSNRWCSVSVIRKKVSPNAWPLTYCMLAASIVRGLSMAGA